MKRGVSCLCLTYGRTSLLEEAVECFLLQQWDGPKELLIVNDHPDVELACHRKEVIIFNMKRRLRSLGEKRNLSVALANYDNLLVWDDDDIHLPWRIEESMKALSESPYFKSKQIWLFDNGLLESYNSPDHLFFHGAAAYSRRIFEQIGGYRCINGGEGVDYESRLRLDGEISKLCQVSQLPVKRLYYIYRWTHGYYHATGCVDLCEIKPMIRKGRYELQPHWDKDYCSEIERQIELISKEQPQSQ